MTSELTNQKLREAALEACIAYTGRMTTQKARDMASAMHKIARLIEYYPSEYSVGENNAKP